MLDEEGAEVRYVWHSSLVLNITNKPPITKYVKREYYFFIHFLWLVTQGMLYLLQNNTYILGWCMVLHTYWLRVCIIKLSHCVCLFFEWKRISLFLFTLSYFYASFLVSPFLPVPSLFSAIFRNISDTHKIHIFSFNRC